MNEMNCTVKMADFWLSFGDQDRFQEKSTTSNIQRVGIEKEGESILTVKIDTLTQNTRSRFPPYFTCPHIVKFRKASLKQDCGAGYPQARRQECRPRCLLALYLCAPKSKVCLHVNQMLSDAWLKARFALDSLGIMPLSYQKDRRANEA